MQKLGHSDNDVKGVIHRYLLSIYIRTISCVLVFIIVMGNIK